jgi:hypothetical protein
MSNHALPDPLDSDDDDEQAIQQSLDDLRRGEQGIPVDEAFARLRAKYGIKRRR